MKPRRHEKGFPRLVRQVERPKLGKKTYIVWEPKPLSQRIEDGEIKASKEYVYYINRFKQSFMEDEIELLKQLVLTGDYKKLSEQDIKKIEEFQGKVRINGRTYDFQEGIAVAGLIRGLQGGYYLPEDVLYELLEIVSEKPSIRFSKEYKHLEEDILSKRRAIELELLRYLLKTRYLERED